MKRYKRNALISLVLVFVFMALASGFNSAWGSVLRFFENVPSCYKTLMYHNHLVFSSDISLRTF